MKNRFIPSQRIKGSDKEVFIINYEGSTIEVQRTSNLYEPLIIRLNGELLNTVPSKQNKEIEFSNPSGIHKIQVWNERVENNLIPKIFVKDGIAVVIDGVPVQNTLADPISKFNSSKAWIWLLTTLLFVKAFIIPLSSNQFFTQGEPNLFLFINIILFILSLSAALTFQLNPVRAIWLALVVSLLELADYIFAIAMIKEFGIVVIIFTVLRLSILSSLIYSLHNLRLILNFTDEKFQGLSENPIKQRKVKRFNFRFKYLVIPVIAILFLGGLYFIINEIIKTSIEPSLVRDSSLEFRTDLKLPVLIPFRKGDKWGYCDRNKKIIIEPKYDQVYFFNERDRTAIVIFNGLYGIIDEFGNKLTPYIYDRLERISNASNNYIAQKGRRFGVIDAFGTTIIPFDYFSLKFYQEVYIASVYKGDDEQFLLLDTLGNKIFNKTLPENFHNFSFDEIHTPEDLYSGRTSIKDKSKMILIVTMGIHTNNPISVCFNLKGHFLLHSMGFSEIFPKENYIYCASNWGKMIDVFDYAGEEILSFSDPWYDKEFQQEIANMDDYTRERFTDSLYYEIFFYRGSYYDTKNIICFPVKDLWGAVDSLGHTIITHKYSSLFEFKIKNEFYFIADHYKILNSIGEVIFISDADYLLSIRATSFIKIFKNHFQGILNIEGKEILKPIYKDIKVDSNSNFIVTFKEGKKAVIDFNSRELIPPKYDGIKFDNKKNYIVRFNENWGVLDKRGRVLIPIKYNDINNWWEYYSLTTKAGLDPMLYDLYYVSNEYGSGYVDLNGVEYFEEN
jgi:predicted metalloprotease